MFNWISGMSGIDEAGNVFVVGGGPEDQVTRDLCNNFEKWVEGSTQDTERVEQNQCKKTRMAPKDLIHPGMMIPVQEQLDCATVNLVHPHHIEPSQHGQSLCHVFISEKHGDLKRSEVVNEGSLQWGFKKKVNSSGMNGEFDMSKVQDMTGVSGERSRKIHDLYKRRVLSSDDEVNLIPYNFMQSNRGPWTASLPSTPSSNDFYTMRQSPSRGLKRALSSNILSLKEKPKKQLASNRSPVNMLKLPKDMQGRWSTERYVNMTALVLLVCMKGLSSWRKCGEDPQDAISDRECDLMWFNVKVQISSTEADRYHARTQSSAWTANFKACLTRGG